MKNTMKTMTVKELVSGNKIAKFTHAIAGVLYYQINVNNEDYQFSVDMNDKEDVGTATFDAEIKAITLMRYINKSIKNDCLVKVR